MGSQVIKKPDGRYAIFSTIVDDFTWDDMTAEEYVKIMSDAAAEEARKLLNDLDAGKTRYGRWAMTYEEAVEYRDSMAKAQAEADAEEEDNE